MDKLHLNQMIVHRSRVTISWPGRFCMSIVNTLEITDGAHHTQCHSMLIGAHSISLKINVFHREIIVCHSKYTQSVSIRLHIVLNDRIYIEQSDPTMNTDADTSALGKMVEINILRVSL